ncbi:hypothetical protein [Symbiopectobacterium sp. RP]
MTGTFQQLKKGFNTPAPVIPASDFRAGDLVAIANRLKNDYS